MKQSIETITVGGGCFWCIEAIFAELRGVEEVESGYAGGETSNPTYEQVCSGKTGHAEVVRVHFNPEVISLHDILTIFFTLHDPTTLNSQGADRGTQYRSIILYETPEQRDCALHVMEDIEASGIWPDPLVTEVQPLEHFYRAEDYHQSYFEEHSNQAYCSIVIQPKVAKLRSLYREKLKKPE
jgi:peptide-methionine (S)-S-oxide reductase